MNEHIFENEIFNILAENIISGRLDSLVMQNQAYLQIIEEIDGLTKILDESDFTEHQKLIIDRLVSAHESTVNYYIKLVYQQAYKDCVALLKEIDLLK